MTKTKENFTLRFIGNNVDAILAGNFNDSAVMSAVITIERASEHEKVTQITQSHDRSLGYEDDGIDI